VRGTSNSACVCSRSWRRSPAPSGPWPRSTPPASWGPTASSTPEPVGPSRAAGSLADSLLAEPLAVRLGTAGAIRLAVAVFTLAMAGLAVNGIAVLVWNEVTVSLRQANIPDHLLDRVGSLPVPRLGAQPVGALAAGLLAHAAGLPAVFTASAGCSPSPPPRAPGGFTPTTLPPPAARLSKQLRRHPDEDLLSASSSRRVARVRTSRTRRGP
jgi:hypothetical protein